MAKKFYPVKNDIMFHSFFADPEQLDNLADLVKAVLGIPKSEKLEVELKDPRTTLERLGDKGCVLDLMLKLSDGRMVDVEIQLQVCSWIWHRVLYYMAKMVVGQVGAGSANYRFNDTISILITDEKLFKNDSIGHHKFSFYDVENQVTIPQILSIHTLELPKLETMLEDSALYDWLSFVSAESEEELKMIVERNPEFEKPAQKVIKLNATERLRLEIEDKERIALQRGTEISCARDEGIALGIEQGLVRGIEQGIKQGLEKRVVLDSKETVLNALKAGLSLDTIRVLTGLPQNEIETFANEI
jgi:predicted transposase/invertase (TIGR01784 family)